MAELGTIRYPTKPPKYWLAAKRQTLSNDAAIFRIWWRNYTDAKRMLAWLAADDSEWTEHGLRKPHDLRAGR